MRLSRYLVPTLREDPAEAEIVSHRLMLRAGMIRRTAAGIYSYLPLGLRALRRVEGIVRAEMDRAGALEVFLPVLSAVGALRETGRWDLYGKELMRVRDRHDVSSASGRRTRRSSPTSSAATCAPGASSRSTSTRSRRSSATRSGPVRADARARVRHEGRVQLRPHRGGGRGELPRDVRGVHPDLRALRLRFKAVEADSGQIGGSFSHEFMVLADTGEDAVVTCTSCGYGANLEKAQVAAPARRRPGGGATLHARLDAGDADGRRGRGVSSASAPTAS